MTNRASHEGASPFVAQFETLRNSIAGKKPFLHGPRQLTYGQLFDQVARLAALFERIGLKSGDRVAIISDADWAVIPIFVALLRCGLTAVVMSPNLGDDELRLVLTTAEAKAVFIDRELNTRTRHSAPLPMNAHYFEISVERSPSGSALIDRIVGAAKKTADEATTYPALLTNIQPAQSLPDDVDSSLVAYILFTSGTTSRPKGVEITHASLFGHMNTLVKQYGFDSDTRLLNLVPLHHTDGLVHGVVVMLAVGGSLVRPMRLKLENIHQILDCIYLYRITHFITAPTTLAMILALGDDHLDAFRTEEFRFVISSTSPLDVALWEKFEQTFGTIVVNVYGMTEITNNALYCGPDAESRKLGTVGRPIDCDAKVVDDAGREVAPGVIGELVLRGKHVMKGYFRMPEETEAVLRDGWLHTGDFATQDVDGFFRVVGRKKNMIICGGNNLYPEEITSLLRAMPGVLDACTFGVEDEIFGERAVSCVVPLPFALITDKRIVDYVLERASPMMLPSEIHILRELPRGPAGKVMIGELKRLLTNASGDPDDKRSDRRLQGKLLEVAARVFKISIGSLSLASTSDSVRGWTSLAHVELLMRIEEAFGISLSPRDIMKIRSLEDAARIIASKALPSDATGG